MRLLICHDEGIGRTATPAPMMMCKTFDSVTPALDHKSMTGVFKFGYWTASTAIQMLIGTLKLTRWAARQAHRLFRKPSDNFGTAKWATSQDLKRSGILDGDGLIVGKHGTEFIRDNSKEGSTLVFAPQGAGKGVGIVIPNLLDYQGSVIVTDPKGENYAITQRHRQSYGKVWCLNLESPESSDCFNPMDSIRIGTVHETDDAEALADLLMPHDAHAEQHWRRKARSWLTGFILYTCHHYENDPELITLAQVHRIVSGSKDNLLAIIEDMMVMGNAAIQETANQIDSAEASEECRNILSNIVKGTEAFSDSKAAARVTGTTHFDLGTFYHTPQSLYIVIPEEKLSTYAPFMRVIVGLALSSILRAGRYAPPPTHRPLFLLDECASLGYLEPLEKGMGYLRSYARAMLIFQDLNQLEKTYSKARSMISNSSTQIAFGVNDFETADMLAKRIGKTTIETRSQGVSQSSSALLRHQAQAGQSEAGRWLIDPSEILRMGKDEALVFMARSVRAPIRATRIEYFKESRFVGNYDDWRGASLLALTHQPGGLTFQTRLTEHREPVA